MDIKPTIEQLQELQAKIVLKCRFWREYDLA